MSNNDAKNRSFRMPLVEIIIVVAVFVIISVLLLRLYVAADKLQKSAENVSRATILVQSAGEAIKGCESITEAAVLLGFDKLSETEYLLTDDGIELKISIENTAMNSGSMLTANVTAYSDEEEDALCGITVNKYNPD